MKYPIITHIPRYRVVHVFNQPFVDVIHIPRYHLICPSDYSMVCPSVYFMVLMVFMLTLYLYMVFLTLALIDCNSWVSLLLWFVNP